mgnify:CR=1 FL=1
MYIDKIWALYAFFLVIMQLIHYFAYILIDDCDNYYNKALSYVNYTHISFQPLFYLIGHFLWTLAIISNDPILINYKVEEWVINIPFFIFSILALISSWRLYKHS